MASILGAPVIRTTVSRELMGGPGPSRVPGQEEFYQTVRLGRWCFGVEEPRARWGEEDVILVQPPPDSPRAWVWRDSLMGTPGPGAGGLGSGIPEPAPAPPPLAYIAFLALPKCPLTSPQSVKIPKIAV